MRRRGVGGPGRMAARRMAVRMTRRRRRRMRRRRRRRRIILAGGMIALGAAVVHKLSKKDVERIETETGKPAEELTDEELAAVMAKLNIQGEELSDAEWDELDAADDEEGDEDEDDYVEELERLADLNAKGILTDEEFAAKKKQLLGL